MTDGRKSVCFSSEELVFTDTWQGEMNNAGLEISKYDFFSGHMSALHLKRIWLSP